MINLDGLIYSIYLLITSLNQFRNLITHLYDTTFHIQKDDLVIEKNVQGVLGSIFCVKKYFAILDPRVVSLVRRVVLVPHIYSSLHVLREIQFTVDVENITIFLILSCSRSDSFP